MLLSEKIKLIRLSESMTLRKFSEITGIALSTLEKYEMGKFEPSGGALVKITSHPQFSKYTMWLMTGNIAPEFGQISPALSPDGSENASKHQKNQMAG
ncbi:Helix-turn-helix [Providencia rettgeri]|uniref:helix-turn-helix domain-containing protein n=1 Tax=Providencia rettgeri TaxID=587 RepID=UPI001EF71C9B|nr:helix-turn-helix transcriptional regulator [Providencia rettgeri]CAB5532608.1 Helix-turn-helix [Providencia rettgeri]CAC9165358.1 Helix-turn-helix [Providencia rettgeri]